MRIFSTKSMYDYESEEWVELYFIDDEEVSSEEYFDEVENEEIEICEACGELIEECECCDDYDDEEDDSDNSMEEENRLITECLDVVFDSNACISCSINNIIDLVYRFKEIGRQDAIDQVKDFVGFLDE